MPDLDLPHVLRMLDNAAKDKDPLRVRHHLRQVLECNYQSVMNALHAHREDEEVKFILEHLDLSKDDDDNWIASIKTEF